MPIPLQLNFLDFLCDFHHFRGPLILSFLMLLIFVTLHIHRSFLISATSYFFSCAFLNVHVPSSMSMSLPRTPVPVLPLSCIPSPWRSRSFLCLATLHILSSSYSTAQHSVGDFRIQFPVLRQRWSHVVFTLFTVSPCKWISLSCCSLHPMYSVFVLLIFNPRSSVALLHLSCFLSTCSMLVLHSTIVCKPHTTRGLLFDA